MSNKYALCIGINAYGGGNELQGCVNDAMDWADVLQNRGFNAQLMLNEMATKAGMIQAITMLLGPAQSGDTVVLTYSGHGTWVPDVNGDESDGRDEALCPIDCIETGDVLTDDELYEIFTTHRKRGVRFVFLSDSCHSGTVSRFMQPLNEMSSHRTRFLPPSNVLKNSDLIVARELESAPKREKNSRQSCLLISGCKDTEYSYDAIFGNRYNGAFTYAALRALQQPGLTTYRGWFNQIRAQLPSMDYPQAPQMTGSSEWKNWELNF